VIRAGRFDNELKYEEIKQRDSNKSAFSQSFTPKKRVKFVTEGSTEGSQDLGLEASEDVQIILKPRQPASEGAARVLMGREWKTICTYVQMLNNKLLELQEIIPISKESLTERLMGVED
jgi:hypothetical protein